jgi:uncharacterized membrane protein YfcA
MLDLLPVALFFAAALLFTSVGHGGASGYLAVMGLLGFAPSLMRSTALSLNIAAAGIALLIFMTRAAKDSSLHAGHFARRLLPFLITSLPMSYLGGQLNLHGNIHKAIVGIVLLWAAWQLFKPKKTTFETTAQNYDNPWWVWPVGAAIGFVSGLTGVGGGTYGFVHRASIGPTFGRIYFAQFNHGLTGRAQQQHGFSAATTRVVDRCISRRNHWCQLG